MTAARRRLVHVYALTLAAAVLWVAAIVLAPVLRRSGASASRVIYACFAPVCHQMPERSFVLAGYPLAVCARCFGIYVGFLAGTILHPILRGISSARLPHLHSFLLVSLPIGIDAAANALGLWNTPNLLRFLVGLPWGAILPFYLLTALAEPARGRLAIPAPKK
jgi:uncharacterized membrane protein